MARFTHARNTFQFGEVSPSAFGRADQNFYRQMCEELKNVLVNPLGGATLRPGTKAFGLTDSGGTALWNETDINDYSNANAIKLIPYRKEYADLSATDETFLILTPDYIKIAAGANQEQAVDLTAIGGSTYPGSPQYWTLSETGLGYLYAGFEQYAQYRNLMVIVNGLSVPMFIRTNAADDTGYWWPIFDGELTSLDTISNTNRHRFLPFQATNTTATTFTINTASVGTARTITASANTFTQDMVGRFIRVYNGGTTGLAYITGYTNATTVTVTVLQTFPGTAAYATWAFSYWGGDYGYPRAVAFFEERLFYFGNTGFPDGVWGSQVGDIYELSLTDPTATPGLSDAFYIGIGQNDASPINIAFPRENLFAVSGKKEAYLDSIDQDSAIGNGNTRAAVNSWYGAYHVMPAQLQNSMIYSGRDNRIRELQFNFRERGYTITDLSKFTPTILGDRATRDFASGTLSPFVRTICVTKRPYPIVWLLDTTGKVYSLTRDPETETTAWAHHEFAGEYASGTPLVLDMCVANDKLYLAIVRAIGGATDQICYEVLDPSQFFDSTEDVQCKYMDLFTQGSVSGATVSGFDHFEGDEISIVADGIYLGEYTVTSGDVTLDATYTTVYGGLKYEGLIIPSALEANALFGSGLGSPKRVDELSVLFENTVGAVVGTVGREDLEEEIQFRPSSTPASDPVPLYSGEKYIKLGADYDQRQRIYIKQEKPYPMTVNAVIMKGILYD